MQRILITGGTGFIGRAVVTALRRRGDEPIVVSRRAGPATVGWNAVQPVVERVDSVIHLAGEPVAQGRWTARRLELIRASRIESTERLALAIERAVRKPKVFVSGSAVGLYGMRMDDDVLDEGAPPADDVLARIVAAWEKAAEPARSAGVRVVHPRMGVVLGEGGGALAAMAAPFRWFVGGPLGSGRQWVSWIHLRDVVRALLFVVDHHELTGPVNVVAPVPVTMETLAGSISRALGRPAAMRVPAFALEMALGHGLARMLLTGQRTAPRRLLDEGFVFDFPGIDEACRDLL
jgi:uncharacterized protein